MNIPAVGARVRLRGREGVVSRASLGTVKRLGDEFVSSGAWIEVMPTGGKGHSDLLKLHEATIYFPVPGMYGGFSYTLEGDGADARLVVESWCRVAGGSGQRHVVTADGFELVAEGFIWLAPSLGRYPQELRSRHSDRQAPLIVTTSAVMPE